MFFFPFSMSIFFFGCSAARHLAQHPDDLSTSELHQLLDSWPFNSWFTQQRLPKNQDYDELHMGVSKVMGVAPVIIHFRLGFSTTKTIQLWGYPPCYIHHFNGIFHTKNHPAFLG